MRGAYTYIMANNPRGTFYVGVTSDLIRRVWQHKSGETGGFTSRYGIRSLVYYECLGDMSAAIAREKVLKRWRRSWKISLVTGFNPDWRDLYDDIIGTPDGTSRAEVASSWMPDRGPA